MLPTGGINLFPATAGGVCRLLDRATSPGSFEIQPGDRKTLFKASGSNNMAEVVTMTLQVPRSGPTGAPPFGFGPMARPSVQLVWGVGGVADTAEIDAGRGFTLTVPCSAIEIIGVNDPLPAIIAGVAPVPRNVNMGAHVAYGNTNLPSQVTRTLYVDVNPPGNVVDFFRPPFAKTLIVNRQPFAAAGFGVFLFDEGGNDVGEQIVAAGTNMVPMDLGDDTNLIELHLGAALLTARLIFGLQIG